MAIVGIETGGTWTRLALMDGDTVLALERFPTTDVDGTLAQITSHVSGSAFAGRTIDRVGVAAFGPIDLNPGPNHGRLLATPKPGWSHAPLGPEIRRAFDATVIVDTDVNAAALAEARWGAARGLRNVMYVTVGTGVGVGVLHGGTPVHGVPHPEAGHITVRRAPRDRFPGACPFHDDCLEGLVAGPALEARFGHPAHQLDEATLREMVRVITVPLADGLRSLVYAHAPQRIVMGGGISQTPGLLDAVRGHLAEALRAYPGLEAHADPAFLVPAALGEHAGLAGALAIAGSAASIAPDLNAA